MLQTIPVAGAMDLTKFNITKYRPGVNITAELRDDPKSTSSACTLTSTES